MITREWTSILLGTVLGLMIFLAVGCRNIGKQGPEITGSQMTLLSSNYEVSVPETIDTIAIANQGLHEGKEFKLNILAQEVLFVANGSTQRFQDQLNEMVGALWGRNGNVTSTMPLRNYPAAPCTTVLLNNPGWYKLTLHITPTDSLWEIDKVE